MNDTLRAHKDFRNPSIYEKLIQYCDIDEFGTNYPPVRFTSLTVWRRGQATGTQTGLPLAYTAHGSLLHQVRKSRGVLLFRRRSSYPMKFQKKVSDIVKLSISVKVYYMLILMCCFHSNVIELGTCSLTHVYIAKSGGSQELYDPSIWGKQSFYEELAKVQKEDMERREKERKERTKVSQTRSEGTHQGEPNTERRNAPR